MSEDRTPAKVDSVAVLPASHAAVIGLESRDYASIFLTLEDGQRLTMIGDDVEWIRMLTEASAANPEMLEGMTIPAQKFPVLIPGWPADWGLFDFSDTPDGEPDPDPARG